MGDAIIIFPVTITLSFAQLPLSTKLNGSMYTGLVDNMMSIKNEGQITMSTSKHKVDKPFRHGYDRTVCTRLMKCDIATQSREQIHRSQININLDVTKSDILLEMKNFAEQILPEQKKKTDIPVPVQSSPVTESYAFASACTPLLRLPTSNISQQKVAPGNWQITPLSVHDSRSYPQKWRDWVIKRLENKSICQGIFSAESDWVPARVSDCDVPVATESVLGWENKAILTIRPKSKSGKTQIWTPEPQVPFLHCRDQCGLGQRLYDT
ncbi:hypothetical protein Anapl_09652 [Anas platyrhynchos]|uniref:Uncharacterized protein n=1 Tax=Anas platyrhynchos TaxID=8839 RepID=R0LFN4_ANAPL|nr:hypothetical protein Anapl_09652 [Anas platyrhynchos]